MSEQEPVNHQVVFMCPICNKKAKVTVPEEAVSQKESGTSILLVSKGTTCEHEYYAYLDKNFAVRDYLTLDFSEGNVSFEAKKKEIYAARDEYNLSFDNVTRFLREKDIRSLLYGSFLGFPIIIIENNPDEERLKVVLSLICKINPETYDQFRIYSAEKFLEFSEKNTGELKDYIIYNTIHQLSVQKPFTDTESEVFTPIMEFMKKKTGTSAKVQIVFAQNAINYVKKYARIIEDVKDKPEKIIKSLKKQYPRQVDMFTLPFLALMRKYLEYHPKKSVNRQKSYWEVINDYRVA